VTLEVQRVEASGTIYIRADGSIDPPAAPISTLDNVTYVFTADTSNQSIYVQRNNITIDGRGHVLQGSYVSFSYGICLSNVTNVAVENTRIDAFWYGVFQDSGSNNRISGNSITNNVDAIFLQSTINDSISENDIANNNGWGVVFFDSHNQTLFRNSITNNHDGGVWLAPSSNDDISENNIANNTGDGIALYGYYSHDALKGSTSGNNIANNNIKNNKADGIKLISSTNNTISRNNIIENQLAIEANYSSHNMIYANNFVINSQQVLCNSSLNSWDNGYPSGGNYWSDYNGTDANHDGIGDTPHLIDVDNTDNYPLMGMFYEFNVTYFTPPLVPHACNVTVISNSSVSDFVAPIWIEHPEVIFLEFNVTGANGSTGFCRVSFPTAMMNSTYHVFVNGTEVQHILLPCSDTNNSYLYFDYELSTKDTLKDRADINKDGIVDVRDTAIMSHAWLSRPGDPNWKPEADLNNDGVIDNLDKDLLISVFFERTDIAKYQVTIIPEFRSFLALLLFMMATLLAVMLYKTRRVKLGKAIFVF
jgi:parallel beta-helix repeat protein